MWCPTRLFIFGHNVDNPLTPLVIQYTWWTLKCMIFSGHCAMIEGKLDPNWMEKVKWMLARPSGFFRWGKKTDQIINGSKSCSFNGRFHLEKDIFIE